MIKYRVVDLLIFIWSATGFVVHGTPQLFPIKGAVIHVIDSLSTIIRLISGTSINN